MLKLLVPAAVAFTLAVLASRTTHDVPRVHRSSPAVPTAPSLDETPPPQLPTSGYIPADQIDPPLPSATTLVPVFAGPPPPERHRAGPRTIDGDRPPRRAPGL